MSYKYNLVALQKFADEWATYWWNVAQVKFKCRYNKDIGVMPIVIINTRLTSTAGRAFNCGTKIDLSAKLMAENYEYFAKDTIPHEIAHIVACKIFKSKGHDRAWYDTCAIMGFETTRCHSMTVARRK
jgi:predicted SprT family Zn-dependent metalloprotease